MYLNIRLLLKRLWFSPWKVVAKTITTFAPANIYQWVFSLFLLFVFYFIWVIKGYVVNEQSHTENFKRPGHWRAYHTYLSLTISLKYQQQNMIYKVSFRRSKKIVLLLMTFECHFIHETLWNKCIAASLAILTCIVHKAWDNPTAQAGSSQGNSMSVDPTFIPPEACSMKGTAWNRPTFSVGSWIQVSSVVGWVHFHAFITGVMELAVCGYHRLLSTNKKETKFSAISFLFQCGIEDIAINLAMCYNPIIVIVFTDSLSIGRIFGVWEGQRDTKIAGRICSLEGWRF